MNTHKMNKLFLIGISFLYLFVLTNCKTPDILAPLEPRDFLRPPKILDPTQEFGLLTSVSVVVPATSSIFLAGAPDGYSIEHPSGTRKDVAPENSPVVIFKGILEGGETIDIFATGEARNVPLPSVRFDPNGGATRIETAQTDRFDSITGHIGSLVGIFDNQKQPFIIGQRKHIHVPNKSTVLYLAILDYPGYSSDNQGFYRVNLDVIRR